MYQVFIRHLPYLAESNTMYYIIYFGEGKEKNTRYGEKYAKKDWFLQSQQQKPIRTFQINYLLTIYT